MLKRVVFPLNLFTFAVIYSDALVYTAGGLCCELCISLPKSWVIYKRSPSLEVYNNSSDWLSPQDLLSDWVFDGNSKVYRKPHSSRTLN